MAIYLGPLVQLCCGRETLQTNTTGMCGECSPRMDHTGFITAQGGMYFPGPPCSGSRVPCKCTVSSGPCFSCSSQVYAAQVLRCSARAQTLMGCVLCPSQVQAAQATGAWQALSQVDLAFHAPSWSQPLGFSGVSCVFSGELISG